jgi:D-beta-D-heptose 7-phosphate kinase/D-beta-D-heptose 1-phosphate adenosyltransferase
MVDAVVIFEEDTPLKLITSILPGVLVKGGDYTIDEIAGAKEVIANGGKVVINPILDGFQQPQSSRQFLNKLWSFISFFPGCYCNIIERNSC